MMTAFLADARDVVVPRRACRHGPLPPLLVSMTLVTGLVDAFSYLVLGHVFVANMTGNVVFLGFALAGAPGFSITASLAAVASFAAGALLGGRLGVAVPRPPCPAALLRRHRPGRIPRGGGHPRRRRRQRASGGLPIRPHRGPRRRHGNPERRCPYHRGP